VRKKELIIMAYRNKTKFYRLPSMANGDVLTEEQ
jgi:hypothetical protein